MVGVPKKAQKGPVKHKNITFLFIARLKMLGFLQNLKWNFSFYATSFLQSFVATFEQLHVEIMLKKTKFDQKKTNFWVFLHENTISRSLNPIFFLKMVSHASWEIPEKISADISKKWPSYYGSKWPGKWKKTQFCNFKAVELKNYTKSTWKIDKLKRKCMGNPLLVVWGLYKGAPGNTPQKKAKNGLFWLFFEKFSCLKRPNPSKFVWAILLDVRDWWKENHDGRWWLGYLKRPKKGP